MLSLRRICVRSCRPLKACRPTRLQSLQPPAQGREAARSCGGRPAASRLALLDEARSELVRTPMPADTPARAGGEHREEQDALLVRLLDRLVTGVLGDAERLVVVARHRGACCGRGGGGYRGELVSNERERGGGRREESPPAARPSPCSRRRRPSLARFATNLARFSHSPTAHTELDLTKPRARRKSPCRAPPPSLECSRAVSRALGPARTSYNMHCEGGRYKRGCERD